MRNSDSGFGRVLEFLHHHFLSFLVGAYLLAAVWPSPGDLVRKTTVLATAPGSFTLSLPGLLLAALLFNAGLTANVGELAAVVRRPGVVLVGLAATVVVPIGFLALLAFGLGWWHDPDESRALLIGLGVVAAMPVAGSSTAWSQNAGGSAALSLGLVVASTLLSPLTTPLALGLIGPLTGGEPASDVAGLAANSTVAFLIAGVVVPSVAGMLLGGVLGRDAVAKRRPALKMANMVVLLVLCYANASASLPAVVADADWDYLALVVLAAVGLCGTAFAAGWAIAWLLNAAEEQKRSLVFGLGMSNNGTGLVLAGATLAGVPAAAFPILAYNLVQHLMAGYVHRTLDRSADRGG